jgi:mono/diheme cytochrome c family protein
MKETVAVALLVAAAQAPVHAQAPGARGALLYENHCGACHTTQMHWRDKRVATDWASLRILVRRWQATAQLNWSDEEIDEVARYLNGRFYRFDEPATRISRQDAGRR